MRVGGRCKRQAHARRACQKGMSFLQIQLSGKKGLEITDALRAYVEKRLAKCARYLAGEEVTAQVSLAVEHDRQIVEVTIPLGHWLLRAEDASDSMYAAIDLVVEKLERQIERHRTRLMRKPRHDAAFMHAHSTAAATDSSDSDAVVGDRVLRTKAFPIKPMVLEEAVLQMDLLGHDFFVFRDGTDGGIQVLYRRRGGGLGLIAER